MLWRPLLLLGPSRLRYSGLPTPPLFLRGPALLVQWLLLLLLLLLLRRPCRRLLPHTLAGLLQIAAPAARQVGHWLALAHPPRLLMRMHGPQDRPHMIAPVDAARKGAAHAAPGAVHVLIQHSEAGWRKGRHRDGARGLKPKLHACAPNQVGQLQTHSE